MDSIWSDPHVWFPYALAAAIVFVLFIVLLAIMGFRAGKRGNKKGWRRRS